MIHGSHTDNQISVSPGITHYVLPLIYYVLS